MRFELGVSIGFDVAAPPVNDGEALQFFLFLLRVQQTCVAISYRQTGGIVNIKV
jgi:hypothetical protein